MQANKRKAQSKGAYKNAAKVHKENCRSRHAIKKRTWRRQQYWNNELEKFNSMTASLVNRKGRDRSYWENRMVILALNASLRRAAASSKDNNQQISWRKIEEEEAKDFHLRLNHVIEVRKCFWKME